jgi:threonine/homoserine/homoserine lactone efflux protein
MYTGIFICIGGMLIFIIGHLTWFFVLLDVAGSIYIVYVLTTSAERETQHLRII